MPLLILLSVPLFAAIVLAFIGDRKYAPEINILGSAATFAAGIALALEVYVKGPMLAGGNFFFVDAFNVYLAVLTSFVSMTTAIFSRRYMRKERQDGHVGLSVCAFTMRCSSFLFLRCSFVFLQTMSVSCG